MNHQSSIEDLCHEHPSLSAFVENRIVLGRSPRDITQDIAVRFGLKVSSAAVAAYRSRLEYLGAEAVERTFEGFRQDLERLIGEMEAESGGLAKTIRGIWRKLRRRIGNRE